MYRLLQLAKSICNLFANSQATAAKTRACSNFARGVPEKLRALKISPSVGIRSGRCAICRAPAKVLTLLNQDDRQGVGLVPRGISAQPPEWVRH